MPAVAAGLRVFFASNLRDNAPLMPHYITQMLFTVTSLRAGSAFVSIYESGSRDGTGAWLNLFEALLRILEVPHHIETGGIERPVGMDRIYHLAHMRNLATTKMRQGLKGELPQWHADRLVFINDVYFCARDAVRLLQHVSADLACSMDFLQWKDPPSTVDVYPYGVDGPPLSVVTDPTQLQFYDVWVARDVEGKPLSNTQPYVQHGYSLGRLRQGLPFPVSCCWNGMLSINAEPFRLGYEFRPGREGECRESETSVMCKDFLRMGYSNFIVDPGVRLAYQPADARLLYTSKLDVPVTPWAEVAAAPAIDPDFAPRKFHMTCCNMADDGSDHVDFFKCRSLPEVFSRTPSAALAA
ncbi:probable alpha-1,3-mannosyltransferase CMT1 [Coccomyxa sp. Obi]|nr:probable alpha-1,3-mannosyltransferase CMT1 [Coccomyxa sp. Obi]